MAYDVGVRLDQSYVEDADQYKRGYAWGEKARYLATRADRDSVLSVPVRDSFTAGAQDAINGKPAKHV